MVCLNSYRKYIIATNYKRIGYLLTTEYFINNQMEVLLVNFAAIFDMNLDCLIAQR